MSSIFSFLFGLLRQIYNVVASWYGFSFVFICSVVVITIKIFRDINGNNK